MRFALEKIAKLALAALAVTLSANIAQAKATTCPGNAKAIGVSRTIEIDTTGGPGFGMQQYRAYDFLKPGEVVLTFDDGPLPGPTRKILKALANHCTKAIFFPVGKLAAGYPEVLRAVAKAGHSIGAHTYNHIDLRKNAKKPSMKSKAASPQSKPLSAPRCTIFSLPLFARQQRNHQISREKKHRRLLNGFR